MANIPVEKTSSGAAWLPWLLGLLALAAILFVGFLILDDPDNDDLDDADAVVMDDGVDDDAFVDDPDPMTADVDMDGALTAAALLSAADITEYVGQNVSFTGLRVMEVTGDKTFTVSPDGSDQMMLVYLEEEETPNVAGVEGRYDVNAGQTVDIRGTVQRLTADDLSSWGVSPSGVSAGDAYVRATALDLMNADLDQVEVDDATIE